MTAPIKRWSAYVGYKEPDGRTSSWSFEFEEFDELGDRIERGPDWGTIAVITVTLNRRQPAPTPMEASDAAGAV